MKNKQNKKNKAGLKTPAFVTTYPPFQHIPLKSPPKVTRKTQFVVHFLQEKIIREVVQSVV